MGFIRVRAGVSVDGDMNNCNISFIRWGAIARHHPSALLLAAQLMSLGALCGIRRCPERIIFSRCFRNAGTLVGGLGRHAQSRNLLDRMDNRDLNNFIVTTIVAFGQSNPVDMGNSAGGGVVFLWCGWFDYLYDGG